MRREKRLKKRGKKRKRKREEKKKREMKKRKKRKKKTLLSFARAENLGPRNFTGTLKGTKIASSSSLSLSL